MTLSGCVSIEILAFVQNLATSIMSISLGQFAYSRFLTRYLNEVVNSSRDVINSTARADYSTCFVENQSLNETFVDFVTKYLLNFNFLNETTTRREENPAVSSEHMSYVRERAQADTANLFFISGLCNGIPRILMTNILSVNICTLGRKTIMIFYLCTMNVKYVLITMQCVYPNWPDWLFYTGAFIEGLSGASGVFYLSLYCYLADLTSPSSRSYRITLLNNLNSLASLCVTFACGYVIKYWGYLYLFVSSLAFMGVSLVYTTILISDELDDDMSLLRRIKLCSLRRAFKFSGLQFGYGKDEADSNTADHLSTTSKQSFVLLMIVYANFLYNFGTNGIGSIFTLFVMNAPYCFDSVQISNYSVFSTIVSLVASLVVSKFVKINDVLICFLSVMSYFVSVMLYVYGNSIFYLYVGAVISSIGGLEYSYVRSIVSKSVEKHQLASALSLILIADTIIGVFSVVIFPILYSNILSKGTSILFSFSNGFILMSLLSHLINYFLYEPKMVQHEPIAYETFNNQDAVSPPEKWKSDRFVSLSDGYLNNKRIIQSSSSSSPKILWTEQNIEELKLRKNYSYELIPPHEFLFFSTI